MADNAVKRGPRDSSATATGALAKPAVLADPVYEFSAPRFYDFATNSQDLPSAERADAWFDTAGTASNLETGCNSACTTLYQLEITFTC